MANKEVPYCGPIPNIGTFLPRSFGYYLPVISTIPGDEEIEGLRITSIQARRVGKTYILFHQNGDLFHAGPHGALAPSAPQEAKNNQFCPFHEKFHTVVLKGVRNISGTLQIPPMDFFASRLIWSISPLLMRSPRCRWMRSCARGWR